MSKMDDDLLKKKFSKLFDESNAAAYGKIRESYNILNEEIQKSNDESGEAGVTIEELLKNVDRANEIYESGVKRAQEACLDAKCLKKIAFLGRTRIEKTQSCLLRFSPSEYADKLLKYLGEEHENLNDSNDIEESISDDDILAACKEFESLYSETYGIEPIFGAIDWKAPEKKKKSLVKDNASQKKAEKVLKVTQDDPNEQSEVDEINRLFMILNKRYLENRKTPIIFMEFIVDPNSFSNTVENMFHTSFLLHDGFAKVAPCKQFKIPRISPIPVSERKKDGESDTRQSHQVVLNMNIEVWQELIHLLDLKGKAPMIPARTSNKRKIS